MDESTLSSSGKSCPSLRIHGIVAYLRQRPQELIDAKRLLRRFGVSAEEFHQALLLLDHQSLSQSSLTG